MRNKYVYWRIVALVSGLWISVFFALSYFSVHEEFKKYYFLALIPFAVFMIYSEIHQMRFPLDLRIYLIWVFLFSYLAVAYGSTAMSMMIFYCACYLGIRLRIFGEKYKSKMIVAAVFFVLSAAGQVRLDKTQIIDSIQEALVSLSALGFMTFINRHLTKKINQDIYLEAQKENLNDYFEQYNFTERDKQMLEEVLKGCKYEEIAINHKLSLSSVKQRLGFLYKKLGVTCQIDFIVKFSPKKA